MPFPLGFRIRRALRQERSLDAESTFSAVRHWLVNAGADIKTTQPNQLEFSVSLDSLAGLTPFGPGLGSIDSGSLAVTQQSDSVRIDMRFSTRRLASVMLAFLLTLALASILAVRTAVVQPLQILRIMLELWVVVSGGMYLVSLLRANVQLSDVIRASRTATNER